MPEIEADRQHLHFLLDHMQQVLDHADAASGYVLAQLRWELARRLFPYLTVDGLRNPRRKASCGVLLERVRGHFKTWDSSRIDRDWPTYRREARGLVQSLRLHLG